MKWAGGGPGCGVEPNPTAARLRKRIPFMKEMEQEGQNKIGGALYDMKTGKVTLLD